MRKSKIWLVLAFFISTHCAQSFSQEIEAIEPVDIWTKSVRLHDLSTQAFEENKLLFAVFRADPCGVADRYERMIERSEKIMKLLKDYFITVHVDLNSEGFARAQLYNLPPQASPTTIIYAPYQGIVKRRTLIGERLLTHVSSLTEAELISQLESLVKSNIK